ncbi:MAG: amino acid ABC transporter substrate-binding protein [Hyphomicrobiales bacterium]|nr:amino acid ABC transporter substrate-binding protein [Hyphomicrobiales bacterium]
MFHYRKTIAAATLTSALIATSCTAYGASPTAGKILLGSAISLTGKYATAGHHAKTGYDFAIAKINAAGGVKIGDKTYMFEVKYYDDESTPARGGQLAERLINQDGVQYMLGPYSSGLTRAIAPVTEKYKIPMVEAEGASRSLFNKGYKYLFAVLSTSEQYLASAVALAARVAKENGKAPADVKVALAFENDPFSLDVRAGVMDDIKKHGLTVVIDDKLPRNLTDMTPTMTKIKALKPDLLVVSGHSKGAGTATRQIAEMKLSIPMVAMTHCESADLVGKYGPTADGYLCATQWAETLTYKDPIFGSASEFNTEIKKTVPAYAKKSVPYQLAQAAAAVYVFKDAFERSGSLDKDKLRDALATTDLTTFYGKVKFSDAGNNIAKPMVLRQIQGGKYNVVAPVDFASHELEWPRK